MKLYQIYVKIINKKKKKKRIEKIIIYLRDNKRVLIFSPFLF